MGRFSTPRRRTTRQRSGFNVSGERTGSTCEIASSQRIEPVDGKVIVEIHRSVLKLVPLFLKPLAVFGFGAYVRVEAYAEVAGALTWDGRAGRRSEYMRSARVDPGRWSRLGALVEVNDTQLGDRATDVTATVEIMTNATVDVYGFVLGALTLPYFVETDVAHQYRTRTSHYVPEILYLDPSTDALEPTIRQGRLLGDGAPLVCKSCNRCSRYLPINIEDERNTLSFSNHCVRRAPCRHGAFSSYLVEEESSPAALREYGVDDRIQSYYGHQLECIVCKKFFVNAPLNPMRNSTQHREDSLRRRAFEVLVSELLDRDWIYHEHRLKYGTEFDEHIWRKFSEKCFNCGKPLESPNAMALDHTLPLLYLWPLDDRATCLCPGCNGSKSYKFPVEFYRPNQLRTLSDITGIAVEELSQRRVNDVAVEQLFERIEWFFDEFLAFADYQKIRNNKRAADLIVHALHNVLRSAGYEEDLVAFYRQRTGAYPTTVTMEEGEEAPSGFQGTDVDELL